MATHFLACAAGNTTGDGRRHVRSMLGHSIARNEQTVADYDGMCLGWSKGVTWSSSGPPDHPQRVIIAAGDGLPIHPAMDLDWLVQSRPSAEKPQQNYSRRFVLVGWDVRARELLVARDPLGMEPVYFASLPGHRFLVCSRALALTEVSELSLSPNIDACAVSLFGLPTRDGATLIEQVRELPRASILRLRDGAVTIRRYVRLNRLPEIHGGGERHLQMRQSLEVAVTKCIQGSRHVGVMLSGGLDSTSVYRSALQQTLTTATPIAARFPQYPEAREDEFFEYAVEGTGCKPECFEAGEPLPISACLVAVDDPVCLPTCSITLACARRAQALGVDCLLTGEFGDFVGGEMSSPIAWLMCRGHFAKALQVSRVFGGSLSRQWTRCVWQGVQAQVPWFRARMVRRMAYFKNDLRWLDAISTTPSSVIREMLIGHWMRHLDVRVSFAERAEDCFDRSIRRSCGSGWLSERMTGVRIEHPMADPALVRLAIDLDFDERWSGGLSRIALRRAMEGVIPPQIQKRGTKARLYGHHLAFFEQVRRQCPQPRPYWPLDELLGLRTVYPPSSGAESHAFRYTEAKALTIAAWLRMVLRQAASK